MRRCIWGESPCSWFAAMQYATVWILSVFLRNRRFSGLWSTSLVPRVTRELTTSQHRCSRQCNCLHEQPVFSRWPNLAMSQSFVGGQWSLGGTLCLLVQIWDFCSETSEQIGDEIWLLFAQGSTEVLEENQFTWQTWQGELSAGGWPLSKLSPLQGQAG